MVPTERTDEFLALWSAHARQVYSYIYSLLPHWADAEEAFQETSRVLWQKFNEFERDSNFGAWACRIAYFKVLDIRRRRKRGPLAFSDAFVDTLEIDLADTFESFNPRYAALLACLEKLTPRDVQLIQDRYREGATTDSVAAERGRSCNAIYKALNRIHRLLLECIQRTLRQEEA